MQAGIECLFVIGTAPLQHRMGVDSSWPGPLWTGGVSAGMKLFLEFKIFLLAVIQFHVTLSTLCTLTSTSTFSILFFVLSLWHWQGEFVYQSMLYLFTFPFPVLKDLLRRQKNFCSVWQAFDILHKMLFYYYYYYYYYWQSTWLLLQAEKVFAKVRQLEPYRIEGK